MSSRFSCAGVDIHMHETEELVYAGNEAENSTSTADLLQATELSGILNEGDERQ